MSSAHTMPLSAPAAYWDANNSGVSAGIRHHSDTGDIQIGDGTTTWGNVSKINVTRAAAAYAYLSAQAATTVTTSGAYVPIAGTFTNDLTNFIFDTDHIEYSGAVTQKFEIKWNASFSCETASRTVKITVKVNSTEYDDQAMQIFGKNAGQIYSVSGILVVSLETDDEIQLIATADADDETLTFESFTTSINRFIR